MTQEPEGYTKMQRLLFGRTVELRRAVRTTGIVLIFTAIFSLSFCQLGFWSIGFVQSKPVYLLLILAPLLMGSLLYGKFMGAIMGLFTGAVLFLHAKILPLDYYEIYFMTPLNTFVLFTVIGFLGGILFDIFLRKSSEGTSRIARIIVVCVVMSVLASALVQVNTILHYFGLSNVESIRQYLLISPMGFAAQVLIDAAIISLFCCIADKIVYKTKEYEGDRRLLVVFRAWMLGISLIVFMLSSAVNFSLSTFISGNAAESEMLSEVNYLATQFDERQFDDPGEIVKGYSVDIDGYVMITDKAMTILATDDEEKYPVGAYFLEAIGYGHAFEGKAPEEAADEFYAAMESVGNAVSLDEIDSEGVPTMGIVYLTVQSSENGYAIIISPKELVFAGRFSVMAASTAIAFMLILSIGLVASRLLNQVVVRRIDETNDSLDKITHGDLNERVDVRDSREFKSLSSGINMTVSALKDSIAEAEQRNAQELATAKAIQESALPTDFPAFPEVDRFDLYASMKTAKEVGGDFYDFFLVEDSTEVGFVMADVSGKGIPAALFMMTAKTQVRTYLESGLDVGEAVNAANHQLCLNNEAGMFVTMFACVLNYETGELSYVNAGHNPPLIHRNDSWEWIRDVSGMPLGLFDGIPYDEFKMQLNEEDMMYLYTDGVTEAMDAEGNLFGEDRLEETLYRYSDYNPRSVCVGVRRAITDFTQDCEQSDDITMLGFKYGVPPETSAVMVLEAKADQLVHVINYINAELHRRHAPKSVYNTLEIAAEELFVNVCHYAYPDATPENPGLARISFEYEPNPPSITVQIIDDGIPYNPLEKPDAVTPDDIMEVPIGGLGILMAKKSVDEMTYERDGESNVLTFKKAW